MDDVEFLSKERVTLRGRLILAFLSVALAFFALALYANFAVEFSEQVLEDLLVKSGLFALVQEARVSTVFHQALSEMCHIAKRNQDLIVLAAVLGGLFVIIIGYYVVKKIDEAFQLRHKITLSLHSTVQQQKELNEELRSEIKKRVLAEKELQEMAITDGLTGLYNHRYMNQFLHIEHNRALRYQHDLSVIMLDIDYFKNVNDSYGHGCGDVVLLGIAEILQYRVRSTDMIARFDAGQAVVARYGGEEMAVILPQTPVDGAVGLAEDLRRMIEAYTFYCEDVRINVTVSLGVAATTGDREETWSALLGMADAALYRAKNEGRNRVVRFS